MNNKLPNQDDLRRLAEERERMIGNFDDHFGTENELPEQQALGRVEVGNKKQEEYNAALETEQRFQESEVGRYNVHLEEIPSFGMFYPEDTKMSVRMASVEEIRHYSSMDETDLLKIDEAMSMLFERCCRITMNGKPTNYKDLLEGDKFYLLLKIRDLTFKNKPNKLLLKGINKKNGKSFDIDLRSEILSFLKLDPRIEKHYDSRERCFVIKSKNPEIGTFRLYPPTIGTMSKILSMLKQKSDNNEFYDEAFYKIVPFITKNWRVLNDESIKKLEAEYRSWSLDKISAVLKLIPLMKIGVEPEVVTDEEGRAECDELYSGLEVRTPISFPGGLNSIFLVDVLDDL